jgi:2,3-dihydroxybiphenyl 1,2-dioxygenase
VIAPTGPPVGREEEDTVDHQLEFAYLVVEVADPDGLGSLLTDVVGLVPGDRSTPAVRSFRNDDRAARVFVTEGPRDDCSVLGFVATDEAAFEDVSARLASAGFPLVEEGAERAGARGVRRLRSGTAPWSVAFELVLGLEASPTPFHAPLVAGGFQTAGVGVGHTALAVLEYEASERFLLDGLGMVQSDWIETELMEGVPLEVRFYHCNERHHSIALAKVPFDLGKALHHVQFEVNERDDVGLAFDRAWDAGLPFANGIGVHDNEGAFSFYVVGPAGFLVEVGHGTKKVGDPWEGNRRYDRISRWGHQPIHRG